MNDKQREMLARCRRDPALYARAFHKFEPEPHQEALLRAVADPGVPRLAVRSGRQSGKTVSIALLAAWFLWAHRNARVLVTAPSSGQLEDAFLPELKGQINRLPDAIRDLWTVKKERLEFLEDGRRVRVVREDAEERGIESDDLIGTVEPISRSEIPELLDRYDDIWHW